MTPDPRRSSPAALRNREVIAEVLERVLPRAGLVLQIAEGSGEHVVFFAERLTRLTWQPTDRDADALASIAARVEDARALENVRAPLALDVSEETWPLERADAIVCINMIHASPWESTLGLMRGAGRVLAAGGPLVLYGAYKRGGEHTAPSNIEFDAWLKARDPRWGVRDLETVLEVASAHGLELAQTIAMPANNEVVVLRASTPLVNPAGGRP